VKSLESTDFYKRQLEDEIESLNNRVQELEKENYDLRNENKNLKKILKSNNFAVGGEYSVTNEKLEESAEVKAFLNGTQQSANKGRRPAEKQEGE